MHTLYVYITLVFNECLCHTVCPERVPLFEGSQGVILWGQVGPPPLEGVAITATVEGGEEIHTTTDKQGQYRSAINHPEHTQNLHIVSLQ